MALRTSQLSHNTTLDYLHDAPANQRANKIICTIGPKTQPVAALRGLMQNGMNVARMNFSHGSHEYHGETIANVRQAAKEEDRIIAIALDTKGPEIRSGLFVNGECDIKKGQTVNVVCDPNSDIKETGTADAFYCDYANLCKAVKVGGSIMVDDGVLQLLVQKVDAEKFVCECIAQNDHHLTNRRGINLPHADVDLPAVSEKDRTDLQFGAQQEVDYVFASFIRSAAQVHEVRAALGDRGDKTLIFSKIENHQGVENIDEIIEASDGIMVARGDLGVEIPAEKVIVAQKMMISKCNKIGKPVIVATQMLESMTNNPRPTRAEVSDVANAVLDGADCVMLSGETAKGAYPNEVVAYMSRICCEAQATTRDSVFFWSIKELQNVPMAAEESICSSAVNTVLEVGAKALIVLSNTGRSARLLAKYRPNCQIYCATERKEVARALCAVRSVIPCFFDNEVNGTDPDREKRVAFAIEQAKKDGVLAEGDCVVAVHADLNTKGFANQTRVLRV